MISLTLEQVREATGAQLSSAGASITSVCTDSRKIDAGCLFIALAGDVHDGHDHIESAIKGGAAAVLVEKDVNASISVLRVENTRIAMGQLATRVRHSLKGSVIAVAGSNGKTGTKNLLHAALKSALSGTISPKSFNNDIGVPATIFAADPDHEYLVLEIGTNHHGEILNLTNIARPDVAIITNIGAEHLEFLGDLEGVRSENAQIIAGLNPDGLLLINGDSSGLTDAVASYPGRIVTFGLNSGNDLQATDIECQANGVKFRLDDQPIFIPLMGRHTAVNALAAIAVARHLDVPDSIIIEGLSTATGPEMRLQLQSAGSIRILNDAYNANPHSMRAGLETLRDLHTDGRRVAILGDMLELGHTAEKYHREIGQFAAECGLDLLICVGPHARLIAAGLPGYLAETFSTAAACAAEIGSMIAHDDLILLKASRGMKLEIIARAISTASAAHGLRREVSRRSRQVLHGSRNVDQPVTE